MKTLSAIGAVVLMLATASAQAEEPLDNSVWGVAALIQYQANCGRVNKQGKKIAIDVMAIVGQKRIDEMMYEVMEDRHHIGNAKWCSAIRATMSPYVD